MESSPGVQRVAFVTGGARGIGAAVARSLARDGRAVAVADLLEEQAAAVAAEITADGGSAIAVAVDVTDGESVRAGVEAARDAFGPIGILVSNAGWDRLAPFLDTDEQFWERIVDINFKGALRVTHAVLGDMVEQRWGRVVCIASDAARVGSSLESVYAGAKAALIAFAKTIAREHARHGVTANAVCPGPTETPLLAQITSAAQDATKVIEAMTRAVPMRRLGQPEEVAAAVAFLASEQAGFITGQTLSVSGGLTMV
jgi:2-hydroxycyclohexanecarboxyl-CoA dehydrogenase